VSATQKAVTGMDFLANRFIIKLEGYTMPSGTGGLVFFFDKIKRKELIEKMKKN
jgi:hypothetical protein